MFSDFITLFLSSFISSTLFPGGSELLLIYYINTHPENAWIYFSIVTAGNSLGAIVTYFMGYYFNWGRKSISLRQQKVLLFCRQYGSYSLLLSWLPIVGDLLPLVAGWMQLPFIKSTLFIIVGKALRYFLILVSTLYFL